MLWMAAREGEPSWDGGSLGRGRPGWHIECVAIALDHLGMGFDVQGGGSDLAFPHHEMGASHAQALTGEYPFAKSYVHAGHGRPDGEKMSKSKGNLVFVSKLRRDGVDPAAIRLALLSHHYRADWEWTDARAPGRRGAARPLARRRLPARRAVRRRARRGDPRRPRDDLDAPAALAAVDRWAALQQSEGGTDEGAPGLVSRAVDALLGVAL